MHFLPHPFSLSELNSHSDLKPPFLLIFFYLLFSSTIYILN